MTQSLSDKLARVRGKTTEGPWRFELNLKHKSITLCGGPPKSGFGRYDLSVMQFRRWGMGGAQPYLRTPDCIMKPASDFGQEEQGREHHADWFQIVNHPDAQLMELAPELLSAYDERGREIERLRGEFSKVYELVNPTPEQVEAAYTDERDLDSEALYIIEREMLPRFPTFSMPVETAGTDLDGGRECGA